MIQKIDSVNFGMKQMNVLKTEKRVKNGLSTEQIHKFNQEMRKVAEQARINAAKAWISSKDVICGPSAIKNKTKRIK